MARILAVDDDIHNLELIKSILDTNNSYHLITENNSGNVLSLVQSTPFDLIILDITMPDISGLELCKDIKQLPEYKNIPILFLTAQNNSSDMVSGFESGAVDYIIKPFIPKVLLARISTHLTLKKSRDEINDYLDLVEANNKLITDSLLYAQKIQNALFPDKEKMLRLLPKSFVFHLPKNIVSGDFYWIKQAEDDIYVAVADCTGHGVPGAFMSTLGISFLENIVGAKEYRTTGEILNQLRYKIKTTLNQSNKSLETKDGMDLALCKITPDNTLEYSGAYIPLILLRNSEIIRIDADRQPISIYEKESDFRSHKIKLEKNDTLYLYSDGFIDQFCKNNVQRYKRARFREFIKKISKEPITSQKMLLFKELNSWMGNTEQTDDILVMGIQF